MIGFQELTRRQIYILSAALSAVLLIAMVATFRSCRPHTYPAELVAADSLCDSNADSAAVVLSRLERSGGYDGADRMYLDLLKVKLTNNLYEPQKDSTIFRVVDYFEDMGDRKRLCQAYFYKGKYYKEHNDAPQSLRCFQLALDNADSSTPVFFRSKIYSQTGTFFFYQKMYRDALSMYGQSYRCDSILNDTVNMIHSLRDLSEAYKFMDKTDSCRIMLKKAFDMSGAYKGTDLYEGMVLAFASLYLEMGKTEKAHAMISDYGRYDFFDRLKSPGYCILANMYNLECNTDSSLYYCRKLLSVGTASAKVFALRLLTRHYSSVGDMASMRNSLDEFFLYSDSLRMRSAADAVAQMHSLYNYGLREKENLQLKQKNTERTYMMAFLLLLLLLLFSVFVLYRKKKTFELRQMSEHLSSLSEACRDNAHSLELKKEEIQELEEKMRQLREASSGEVESYKEKIHGLTDALSDALSMAASNRERMDTERVEVYDMIKERIRANKALLASDWNKINSFVDMSYPDFKSTLLSLSALETNDYRICVLVKLGLLNSEIAKLSCRRASTISMARTNLYKKIKGESGTAKDFDNFIKSL